MGFLFFSQRSITNRAVSPSFFLLTSYTQPSLIFPIHPIFIYLISKMIFSVAFFFFFSSLLLLTCSYRTNFLTWSVRLPLLPFGVLSQRSIIHHFCKTTSFLKLRIHCIHFYFTFVIKYSIFSTICHHILYHIIF